MDKGIILLIASIVLLVVAASIGVIVDLMLAIPFAIVGFIGLFCLKVFYKVVQPNEAHVRIFQNKKEVFIAREDSKLAYFEIPMVMQVIILQLAVFKTEIENYSFEDKNFAPFRATVVPYFIIDNARIASEKISNTTELHDQLTKIVLSVSRATMLKWTIKEIMSDRQKVGGLIENEVSTKLKEFGVTLKNFELVDIMDEEGSHVIRDLNKAEEARIESDSRKVQAEKNSDARKVEAERDQAAQMKEIERDKAVGVAQQLRDEEIAKKAQDAITSQKKAKEIETIRQKEIDKEAAQLSGEATAVQTIKIAGGDKSARVLEAEGEAAYVEQTGKAEGEKIAAAGKGKAAGILAEAEAMQKYDVSAKHIKGLTVQQAIENKYAEALGKADVKFMLTGKPEGGLLGMLSPEGGARIGQALDAYSATKGDASGLIDVVSNEFGVPKEIVKNVLGNLKKNKKTKSKEERRDDK